MRRSEGWKKKGKLPDGSNQRRLPVDFTREIDPSSAVYLLVTRQLPFIVEQALCQRDVVAGEVGG